MIELTTNEELLTALETEASQAKLSGPLATSYRKQLIALELKSSKFFQIAILSGALLGVLLPCLFPQLSPYDGLKETLKHGLPLALITLVCFYLIYTIGLLLRYRNSKLIIDLDTYRKARKINEKISPEIPFSLERTLAIYQTHVALTSKAKRKRP